MLIMITIILLKKILRFSKEPTVKVLCRNINRHSCDFHITLSEINHYGKFSVAVAHRLKRSLKDDIYDDYLDHEIKRNNLKTELIYHHFL